MVLTWDICNCHHTYPIGTSKPLPTDQLYVMFSYLVLYLLLFSSPKVVLFCVCMILIHSSYCMTVLTAVIISGIVIRKNHSWPGLFSASLQLLAMIILTQLNLSFFHVLACEKKTIIVLFNINFSTANKIKMFGHWVIVGAHCKT